MSKSMMGYVDRKVPAGKGEPVRVKNVMNRVYQEKELSEDFKALTDQRRTAFENEVYRSAAEKLEPKDRAVIIGLVKSTDPNEKNNRIVKIKNFGVAGMYELAAKLGIFLNAECGMRKSE